MQEVKQRFEDGWQIVEPHIHKVYEMLNHV